MTSQQVSTLATPIREAGLSTRALNALVYSLGLADTLTLGEARAAVLAVATKDGRSPASVLGRSKNCGKRTVDELCAALDITRDGRKPCPMCGR